MTQQPTGPRQKPTQPPRPSASIRAPGSANPTTTNGLPNPQDTQQIETLQKRCDQLEAHLKQSTDRSGDLEQSVATLQQKIVSAEKRHQTAVQSMEEGFRKGQEIYSGLAEMVADLQTQTETAVAMLKEQPRGRTPRTSLIVAEGGESGSNGGGGSVRAFSGGE